MAPSCVCMPVWVTTQRARPLVICEPAKTMFVRSPTGQSASSMTSVVFETGSDSPVSSASSESRFERWPSSTRASAGTTSPILSRMMSPGTTSWLAIVSALPSVPFLSPSYRTTTACGAPTDSNAATVFSALYCEIVPVPTLRATSAKMTPPEIQSIVPNETAIAAIRTRVIALSTLRAKTTMSRTLGGGLRRLGP